MRIDSHRRNAKLICLCISVMPGKIIEPQQISLLGITGYLEPFSGQQT
jgi:hypothetical protein